MINVTLPLSKLKPKDARELVKSIEHKMNGKCVKAVTATIVFDEDHNIITTTFETAVFHPGKGAKRFFKFLSGNG